MRKLLIFIALFGTCFASFAQSDSPTLSADRPGMATGPDITPFLKVVWETGFESTWDGDPDFLLPTTMLRFGVTKFAELRLEYDGTFGRLYDRHWSYDVQPLVIGTKVKIFEGYKWVPKISLMANLAIPLTACPTAMCNPIRPPRSTCFSKTTSPTGSTSATMSARNGRACRIFPAPSWPSALVSTSANASEPSWKATTTSPATASGTQRRNATSTSASPASCIPACNSTYTECSTAKIPGISTGSASAWRG